jgi:hypothetical protein
MEKQTKILLVIGAAVVAYLIFKPKKSATQTMVTPSIPKSNAPLTDRQTNVNNMFSTTDSAGVIRNQYSGSNGTKFDDYVTRFKITQAEIDVAKSYYPNAPLSKSNYKVSNVRSFTSSRPLVFD